MDQSERSEDCLFLNVWTAGTAGKRPVLLWIHGGGFGQGSASVALYHGEFGRAIDGASARRH